MSIITPIRIQNREYNEIILYKAIAKASGDVAYFIYPHAGVTRYGVGNTTVQINLGGATSVTLAWGLFDVSDLTAYLADQAKVSPVGINSPKFINLGSAVTADSIIQITPPYSALRATFSGTVSPDTWVTVGVS